MVPYAHVQQTVTPVKNKVQGSDFLKFFLSSNLSSSEVSNLEFPKFT